MLWVIEAQPSCRAWQRQMGPDPAPRCSAALADNTEEASSGLEDSFAVGMRLVLLGEGRQLLVGIWPVCSSYV